MRPHSIGKKQSDNQPWFDMDCMQVIREAGFNRWKVVAGRFRIRVSSIRIEIQINTTNKPQNDNTQKTTKTGINDPFTSIDL